MQLQMCNYHFMIFHNTPFSSFLHPFMQVEFQEADESAVTYNVKVKIKLCKVWSRVHISTSIQDRESTYRQTVVQKKQAKNLFHITQYQPNKNKFPKEITESKTFRNLGPVAEQRRSKPKLSPSFYLTEILPKFQPCSASCPLRNLDIVLEEIKILDGT